MKLSFCVSQLVAIFWLTGMTGVAGGITATLGMLNPDSATLMQMSGAMGTGGLLGLFIAQKIKVGYRKRERERSCEYEFYQKKLMNASFTSIGNPLRQEAATTKR